MTHPSRSKNQPKWLNEFSRNPLLVGVFILSSALSSPSIRAGGPNISASHRNPAFATGPELFRNQIQSDVLGALEKNHSSKTYGEYATSGYSEKDVFANVRALRDPAAWTALCQALEALNPESLVLFEGEFEKPENSHQMNCFNGLHDRTIRFWEENSSHLKQHLADLSRKSKLARAPGSFTSTREQKISVGEAPLYTRENLGEKEVALTFTDGPNTTRTIRILDILKATGVRATFFHIGELIKTHPEVDHRLVEERHTLGTHTYSHADLTRLDLKRAERQIAKGRDEAEAASGIDAPLFRAPYGSLSNEVRDLLKKRKMPLIQGNIDSQDWKTPNASALFDSILQAIEKEKGGAVTLHETQEQSVIVLRPLIDELKARGYSFVVFVPTN